MVQLILFFAFNCQISEREPYLSFFDLPTHPSSCVSCFATHLHLGSSFSWYLWLNQCQFCCQWCRLCFVHRGYLLLSFLLLLFHRAGDSQKTAMRPNITYCNRESTFCFWTVVVLNEMQFNVSMGQKCLLLDGPGTNQSCKQPEKQNMWH